MSSLTEVVERHDALLAHAERDFAVAAARTGHYKYMWGSIAGLTVFLIVGAVASVVLLPVAANNVPGFTWSAAPYWTAISSGGAGAIGACVSVSWRLTMGDLLAVDPGAGTLTLFQLGSLRPVIGAAFGAAAYFALKSGFVNIGSENRNFYFFAFVAFLAGFSERLVPDLLRAAERRLDGGARS